MSRQIIKKRYTKISFALASPLAVGSGEGDLSDKDLIRDAAGIPYIPATAIAGVVRSALEEELGETGVKHYFGDVDNSGKGGEALESRLIFSDARIEGEKPVFHTSVRDSVCLDEFKTAVPGAKFDMEVLEPGPKFTTLIEQNYLDATDADVSAQIADVFLKGQVLFGAKNTRGYGAIRDAQAQFLEFLLSSGTAGETNGVDAWLKWMEMDPLGADAWKTATVCRPDTDSKKQGGLVLELEQRGGISIRKYTTKVSENAGTSLPDMEQLTTHTGEKESDVRPVIPGTSWAGAFRHHMRTLGLSATEAEHLFGYAKRGNAPKEGEHPKSRIRFSESIIEGAKEKVLSRNAIDRFSGGTKDRALFSEKTFYDGTLQLEIAFDNAYLKDERLRQDREKVCGLLAACVADLHFGFLAVGGETSIGRGLFTVCRLNGKEWNQEEEAYPQILTQLKEVMNV